MPMERDISVEKMQEGQHWYWRRADLGSNVVTISKSIIHPRYSWDQRDDADELGTKGKLDKKEWLD